MHLFYDHTLYSFPLYTFLWPEDGPQWPKHVVVSTINRIQDSCVVTYRTPSLMTEKYVMMWEGEESGLQGCVGYEHNTGPVGAKSSVGLFRSTDSASGWLVREGTIIPLVVLLTYLYK